MLINRFFTMLYGIFNVDTLMCLLLSLCSCFSHAQSFFFYRFFEDIELHKDKDSSKYRFKKDGKKHTLIIQEAMLDDIGMYHAWTNGGHTKGELEVEGTFTIYSVLFFSVFSDHLPTNLWCFLVVSKWCI